MKLKTVRDIRTKPAQVWRELKTEGEIVLTNSGKPFALMISVSEDNLEDSLREMRRLRASRAVRQLQAASVIKGRSNMATAEINNEIRQVRKSKKLQ